MTKYVDGFVTPIPKKNLAKFRTSAKKAAKLFMKFGALEYVECVGTDVPEGKTTSFPKAVKLKKGEVVVFSWIVFKSKTHRDQVMKKIMNDPLMQDATMMPFDGRRMIFGSFKSIVSM